MVGVKGKSTADSTPAIDWPAIEENFQGKVEVWRSLLRRFLDESLPGDIELMRSSIAAGDAALLADRAHKLKGFLGLLQASAARNRIEALEQAAEAGDVHQAEGLLSAFLEEAEKLKDFTES